ncbi:MAG TPA: class I SAM-dependent methyltransferase [Dehalococcoidia bacterium]|nr:class I SAM-dependent methyltransferase [Dehalococcoidia bacterium]
MERDSELFWDERYRNEDAVPERGPAAFLVEHHHLLPERGRGLDVAMGTGRNALYLASLGYEVTGIDVSGVAVERCREEAERRGLRIEAVQADLGSYRLPSEAYDVIIDFYYLQRELAPALVAALRPGGVLVFESFTMEQRRFGWGPQQEEFLLRPGELRTLFPGLEELVYREGLVESQSGRGQKAVAGLVARKRPRPGVE